MRACYDCAPFACGTETPFAGRGTETDEEIEKRLSRIEYELSQKDKYDYTIVNDDLEQAIKELEDIIDRHKNTL